MSLASGSGLADFLFAESVGLSLVGRQEIKKGVGGVGVLDVSLARRGRSRRQVIALGRGQRRGVEFRSRGIPEQAGLIFAIADGPGTAALTDDLDSLEQCGLVPVDSNLLDLLFGIELDDVELQDAALAWDRTFGQARAMRSRGTYRGDGCDPIHQEIIVHRGKIGTTALNERQGDLNIQTQRVGALDGIDDLLRRLLDDSRFARHMLLDRVGAVDACGSGDIDQRHIVG